MNERLIIYISPPMSERAPWHVQCDGRPLRELATEKQALRHASDVARMAESTGSEVVIKVEKPDGSWDIFRI